MLLLRYTTFYICDTVPPCRVHVHIMFTVREGQGKHSYRAENIFIVSMETTGYKIVIDQPLALYAIYKHSPLDFALGSHAYILHINVGSGK